MEKNKLTLREKQAIDDTIAFNQQMEEREQIMLKASLCSMEETEKVQREQEEIRIAIETKYNSVKEVAEQDLLRTQFDRVNEENDNQNILAAQFDTVENIVEDNSDDFVEFEDDFEEEEDSSENDYSNDWGSVNDNPYYNDNLDMDQQSPEFWDNL